MSVLRVKTLDGTWQPIKTIKGEQGEQGIQGLQGVGIERIEKVATQGKTDTYEILYTNGTTYRYNVVNGEVTKAQLDSVKSMVTELQNKLKEYDKYDYLVLEGSDK